MGLKINKALVEAGSIFLPLCCFYLWFQLKTIYGGDSGDLVSAAIVGGIPHPPGYPLWTLIVSLLVKLPFYTPAWRAGLLSSLPAALTLTFLYFIIKRITGNRLAALIAILTLTFNYVFWLYAEVAEVFSLNNLFMVSLMWLFLQKPSKKIILSIFFLTGLSLTHHHIIVFAFPGFIYLALKQKKKFTPILQKNWWQFLLVFLLGLMPLIYLPLSARSFPAVDWSHPVDLTNFIQLVTRNAYGTFRASSSTPNEPVLRWFALGSLFYFFYKDFLLLGLILLILGFFFFWQRQKRLFWFLMIEFLSMAFFVFYASFSLENDFKVATFERFLLMPYLVVSILVGAGLVLVLELLRKFGSWGKWLVFLYPLSLLLMNYPRISILKNDMTVENYARDILDSVPKDGILLLAYDTALFNTQYYYYAYHYRPDIKLIHSFMLSLSFYRTTIKKDYPDLFIPEAKPDKIVAEFIKENNVKLPVFSHGNTPEIEASVWLPRGLLMQYYPSESTPSAQTVVEINNRLWPAYHDPLSGSLKKFRNLFTASILYSYAGMHLQFGRYLLEQAYLDEAQAHLEQSIKLNDKEAEAYYYLGQVFLQKKQCQEAENNFQKILKLDPKNLQAMGFLRLTYLDCFKDASKAKAFENSCLQLDEDKALKLKEL